MAPRHVIRRAAAATLLGLIALGCERDTSGLGPAPPITDPIVFDDGFGSGVIYQAFLGSKLDAVSTDEAEKAAGSASMKVAVPRPGDGSGGYSGGACTTFLARDLSGYNALTFWATASRSASLNVAGLGNDNTGTSRFSAEWKNIPLTTGWRKYVVPIPLPEKLDGSGYRRALTSALRRISEFDPMFLVVALGLDPARGDPTGTWSLSPADFRRNGEMIAGLRLPTVIVQEGGYRIRTLGTNAWRFFEGLAATAFE